MSERRADILGIVQVSREELFASSANSVILVSKDEDTPVGEVYYRDDKFGVRFGDYKPSPIQKVLR